MLKLISGMNTLGKTRYLRWIYDHCEVKPNFIRYDDGRTRLMPVIHCLTLQFPSSDKRVEDVADLLSRCPGMILLDEI